jgi:hypothetical protein
MIVLTAFGFSEKEKIVRARKNKEKKKSDVFSISDFYLTV